jgi:hypothetical protein
MKPKKDVMHAERSIRNPGKHRADAMGLMIGVVLATVILAACSSGRAESDDRWMRGYLAPPDRVWTAIQISLDELGYDIEKENRIDGTMRAVGLADGPNRGIVLKIDQIMRTDVVRVHVNAGGSSSGGQVDMKRLDAAASEFLTLVDIKLGS